MVDDVTVGEVTDVERVGWHAQVTLRVRDDVVLPDNAIADIRQVSLLGEKYVALEPPAGAARRRAGSATATTIPLSATGRNPEVEEVLGALSFLLSGGGVGQLGTITAGAQQGDGRPRRTGCAHLLGSLEDVVGTLDDQKADIIRAMESINNLTATLNAEKQTITDALDVAGPAVEVLADQHDELIAMLASLDRLGVVGTRVIGASKDDLLKTARPPRSRSCTKLHEAGDELAPGLNLLVSFPFPKEASDDRQGRLRQHLDPRRHQPREHPAARRRRRRPPDPADPAAGPRRGRCSATSRSACRAATSPARPARRCSPTSTCSASCKKQCQKEKYQDNPVCQVLNAVPDVPLDELPDVLGGLLGGVLGRLARHLAGAAATPTALARHAGALRRRRHDRAASGSGIAAFLVLSAVGIVYITALLPRLRRPGARAAASPCTRRCRPPAASSRAARSPTAA